MSFAFMLATVLVTTTAVLGRSSGPSPARMTLVEEDQIRGRHDETGRIVAAGDRSSNLKYVMAIQSSSIWTEIKKRSLTINAPQRLDDAVADKSPNDLSDAELALLKQACHDGLKCVAVDQLLVLYSVRETRGDGKLSARTVITKITEVITKYTDEYHEDVYQYEAVTQSDDPSKVYESVTTIVDDNKELCLIDAAAVESQREKVGGGARHAPPSAVNDDTSTPTGDETAVNNDITVNCNAIENYNVNNGTVNNATVELPPTVDGLVVTVGNDGPAENRSPDRRHVDADISTATGDETAVKAVENDVGQERARPNRARDSGTPDRRAEPVSTADRGRKSAGQRLPNTDHGVSGNGSGDNGGGPKANGGGRQMTRRRRPGDADIDRKTASNHSDAVQDNEAIVKNAGENGKMESDTDVVSAGSHDSATIRKGYVANGSLNNGNMVEYDVNNGTINNGRIEGSNADNGIINVGTVNNGPVNYGTYDKYTNNGNRVAMNSSDVQKYLSSVNDMYSTILERLG